MFSSSRRVLSDLSLSDLSLLDLPVPVLEELELEEPEPSTLPLPLVAKAGDETTIGTDQVIAPATAVFLRRSRRVVLLRLLSM